MRASYPLHPARSHPAPLRYFYEPCRTLQWFKGVPAGSLDMQNQCAGLVKRLLSCVPTGDELRMLRDDDRAAAHDAGFMKVLSPLSAGARPPVRS